MKDLALARLLRVLGVVLRSGGVAMVRTILLPAVRRCTTPAERVAFPDGASTMRSIPSTRAGSPSGRGLGQRIAFVGALGFYAGGLVCLAGLAVQLGPLGYRHPIVASLAASIVFFLGGGIVLHVIGRADLPDLRPDAASPGRGHRPP
jgi:hypothetical protein